MQLKRAIVPTDVCFIEVHYRFSDDSHSMDALVQNKCELDFLRLIEAIARTCRAKITIEIEPKIEGGLISRYKIREHNNDGKGKKPIPDAVKIALLSAMFTVATTIVINSISEVTKAIVTNKMKDPILDSLEKEKLKTEIENGQVDFEIKKGKKVRDSLENEKLQIDIKDAEQDFRWYLIRVNNKVAANKWRFKFYQKLAQYDKMSSVSTQVSNGIGVIISPEFLAEKNEFVELGVNGNKQLQKPQEYRSFFLPDSIITYQPIKNIPKRLNTKNPKPDGDEK